MISTRIASAAIVLALGSFAAPMVASAEDGDAAKGAKVFNKCKACHAIDNKTKELVEKNRVGPHLVGIVGREVASVEKFKYSKAMIEWGEDKEWTEELIAEYLAAPKKVVKGTKMAFAGLRKEEQIADVIAYLKEGGPGE